MKDNNLCLCGCEKEIDNMNKQYQSRYVIGHNSRRRKHSEETKQKMRESNKGEKSYWYGRHHSEETKVKISRGNKGKMVSIETGRKISEANKGEKHHMFNKHHSEITKQKIRGKRLSQIVPLKDTIIEVEIQEVLKRNNIPFTTHYPILGQPDVFIEPNICIFVDGCWWHDCQDCGFDNRYNARERDIRVTTKLQSKGYRVLRFWEHDINKDINRCVETIKANISQWEASIVR